MSHGSFFFKKVPYSRNHGYFFYKAIVCPNQFAPTDWLTSFRLCDATMDEGITAELRNRTEHENVVPARGGDFDGAFDMLLTFNLAEIKVLFGRSSGGPTVD